MIPLFGCGYFVLIKSLVFICEHLVLEIFYHENSQACRKFEIHSEQLYFFYRTFVNNVTVPVLAFITFLSQFITLSILLLGIFVFDLFK